MNPWCAYLTLPLILLSAQAQDVLTYDFEDGTAQGWTAVSSDLDLPHAFTQTNEASENGTNFPIPASGDYQMLPLEFENADGTNTRDNPHRSLLARSPEFLLSSGELKISIVGGDGDDFPSSPADLAETTDGEGVKAQGFGLRRVSDDTYVVTGGRTTDDDLYQEIVVSSETLAEFISDTETYTIDVFDSASGGWGWIGFDNVVIPGRVPSEPEILQFDFEDGTAQGWTAVSSDPDLPHAFTQTNEPSENGSNFPVPASGDYQMLPLEFENADGTNTRDGAHRTLLARSPEFLLSSGELKISIVGGDGDDFPSSPADLAETTDGEGVKAQGFGLRRVSDDTYVVTGGRTTDDDLYQEIVVSTETLAEFISDTETYTVDVFDSASGGWGWIGFDNVIVPGRLPVPPEILTFDFEDGTSQGWTAVSSDPDLPHAFTQTNEPSENGSNFPVPASGDYQMLPLEFENADGTNTRDGAHRTLLARSPEFLLSSGELKISIVGGDGDDFPSTPADLAETTDGEGVKAQGFGLRRVSDDTYVVTGGRTTDDDLYQEIVVSAETLAEFISDTETYTVDVFDSASGGWGWIGFDNVVVPGTLIERPIFDFEDGTAQGWSNVLFQPATDEHPGHAFTQTNDSSENGENFPTPASGDYQMLPLEFENADGSNTRDNPHQTLLARSPEFYLGAGDVSVAIVGGDGGEFPGAPGDLAPSTDGEGVKAQGFGLRRVSDDTYVATGGRTTNDDLYQDVVIPAADLADHVSDSETYTIDVFDSASGGWGWIGFDNVRAPGRLASAPTTPVDPPVVVEGDNDGDGMEDTWEARYELDLNRDDSGEDPDEDGLTNLEEFQLRTSPKNADTDADGLKDNVETKTGVYVSADDTGTHPLRPDTDDDGLLDGIEVPGNYDPANPQAQPGSSPLSEDTDGDGSLDGLEVLAGTNPSEPQPIPSNIQGGGTFKILHVWTKGSPELLDLQTAQEVLDQPNQEGFESVEANAPFIHFADDGRPSVFLDSLRPYPLWDNENDGFGARDHFAMRATGQIELLVGSEMTFISQTSGGFALFINDEPITEDIRNGDSTVFDVDLDAGLHDIEYVYWDDTGAAACTLLIFRGLDPAPDLAFTTPRSEPETNPREPFWEPLAATNGGGPFTIVDVTRQPDGTLGLTWESASGQFFEVERSESLTNGSWLSILDEIPAAEEPNLLTSANVDALADAPAAYYRIVRVPPPPLFSADFEEGLGEWTVIQNGIDAPTTWEVGAASEPPGVYRGAGVAGTDLDANFADGLLNGDNAMGISLRSPLINLAGKSRATLRFWHALDLPNPELAGGRLHVYRASDLEMLSAIGSEDTTFSTATEGWVEERVRLPQEAFAAGEIFIEWEFLSAPDDNPDDNGAGWYIDEVSVD